MSDEEFVVPCWCGENDAPYEEHDTSCPIFITDEAS